MPDTPLNNAPAMDPEEILAGIKRWVHVESPSEDAAAVNRMMDQAEADFRTTTPHVERVPGSEGWGDHLIARSPWGEGPGILVLSHLDTVHPMGVLADDNPYRIEDGKVYGPGIYDMKAGAFIAQYAFQNLIRRGVETPLPITFLLVSEEEVGSPTSRALIEKLGSENKYVLVTEPAREGGKIVTARKGVARFEMRAEGRPSHAGAWHQEGRSAIHELARQIVDIEAMTDYDRGVTFNVGRITGGTGVNVVPQHAWAEIDMRVPDAEIADEMEAKILALNAHDPDVTLTVTGGMNRPPYEMTEGVTALFQHARKCAAELGFELEHCPPTGGGSDGNFTAALGIPTLDGMGCDGHGAHTLEEFIYYDSMVERARLMERMFETLT
ncbi:MAG: M20/M25/M40 family metallo-hydrolase [Alphaproteobacteria bacterium]|nr:M20/M25/M40 family metallo-hydrolase [Alphaproteobacteria bacterium]